MDLVERKIPYEAATVVTRRSFVQNNPQAVEAFLRAFTEAIYLAKTNRPKVEELWRQYLKLEDKELIDETYAVYVEKVFPHVPSVSEAGVRTVLDLLSLQEPQAAQVKPADYIDNSFVKKLEDSGFIRQLYGR